jgi:hypothetical protein
MGLRKAFAFRKSKLQKLAAESRRYVRLLVALLPAVIGR